MLETLDLNILNNDRRESIMFSTRTDIEKTRIPLPPSCTDKRFSKTTKVVEIVEAIVDHFIAEPIGPIYNPHPTQRCAIENDVKTVIIATVKQYCGSITAGKTRECLDDEDIFGFQTRDSKSMPCSVEIIPQLQPEAEELLRLRLQTTS